MTTHFLITPGTTSGIRVDGVYDAWLESTLDKLVPDDTAYAVLGEHEKLAEGFGERIPEENHFDTIRERPGAVNKEQWEQFVAAIENESGTIILHGIDMVVQRLALQAVGHLAKKTHFYEWLGGRKDGIKQHEKDLKEEWEKEGFFVTSRVRYGSIINTVGYRPENPDKGVLWQKRWAKRPYGNMDYQLTEAPLTTVFKGNNL